jgi:hypothetical protein
MTSYEVKIAGYPGRQTKVFAASEAGALAELSPQSKTVGREITLRYQDPATGIRWNMTYGFKLIGDRIRPRRLIVARLRGENQPLAVPPAAAD